MNILQYTLPDADFINDPEPRRILVWQPEKYIIVLGQSNNPKTSIIDDEVEKDGLTVMKRSSGGETVILTPNMLVISIAFNTSGYKNPKEYFRIVNERIIYSLLKLGIEGLGQKGISDISIGDKKILGSSVYRCHQRVLYHAVLNVAEPVETITRYLAHPQKEPDYRKGRSHSEFVTSLHIMGYMITVEEIKKSLQIDLNNLTFIATE